MLEVSQVILFSPGSGEMGIGQSRHLWWNILLQTAHRKSTGSPTSAMVGVGSPHRQSYSKPSFCFVTLSTSSFLFLGSSEISLAGLKVNRKVSNSNSLLAIFSTSLNITINKYDHWGVKFCWYLRCYWLIICICREVSSTPLDPWARSRVRVWPIWATWR